MSARLLSFLVWALAAGSLAYWGLRLWDRPVPMPAGTVAVGESVAQGSVLRLLGATAVAGPTDEPAPPPTDLRFQLVGVIAPPDAERGEQTGVALITVDNAAPRAYTVGSEVAQGWTLLSVQRRQAVLQAQAGSRQAVLQLPALPEPVNQPRGPAPAAAPAVPPAQPVAPAQPAGVQPQASPLPPGARPPGNSPVRMAPPRPSG